MDLVGGKGVVTIIVAGLILNIQIGVVCIIAGLVLIIVTRTVSIGSLGGIILFNIMTFVMLSSEYILPVLIASIIIIFKHRKNIVRIINSEENKLF